MMTRTCDVLSNPIAPLPHAACSGADCCCSATLFATLSGRRSSRVKAMARARASSPVTGSRRKRRAKTAPSTPLGGQDFVVCTHTNSIQRERALKVIANPVKWKCRECGTREDLWLCMSCGHVGCGRLQPGKHAKKHWESHLHQLSLQFTNKSCYCYQCDEYVLKVCVFMSSSQLPSPPVVDLAGCPALRAGQPHQRH